MKTAALEEDDEAEDLDEAEDTDVAEEVLAGASSTEVVGVGIAVARIEEDSVNGIGVPSMVEVPNATAAPVA